ncbi:MAG: sigma 54-interacting transcriptional regulator [Acidobacteriota bacterium]|nr:sigma 54-interacting transcriptional regulator [Acidobacteriota bacterium]
MSVNKKGKLSTKSELKILNEITRVFNESSDTDSVLSKLLETCHDQLNLTRSYIASFDQKNGNLRLETAKGVTAAEFRRLENLLSKSFIAEVAQNSRIVILPGETLFSTILSVNSVEDNEKTVQSCVCVPITSGRKTLGAFGIEFLPENHHDYQKTADFLSVLAAMIAQAVKVNRIIEGEKEQLLEENTTLRRELREKYDFGQIVGNSSAMRAVYNQVTQVAQSNVTVLLRGESGTGKEMIANAIHYNSLRTKKAFIKVNCAALPETLIESELFGYEKGAFTGAQTRKKGRFELAEGGTLFLDEIGDLSPQMQIKLLRVIQEREFERVGGTETIKANVRLIAATNKNLEEAIANGSFREDLFYRLNVFTIFLPPLRERKSDILLLAENFVEKYEREHGKHIKRISTPAIDMLTSYHYPGNVRELENAIERAVLVCDGNVIHGHHLPPTLQTAEITGTVTRVSLEHAVGAFERDLIQDALKTTSGNCSKAAKMLNTTDRILGYKIKKYKIETRRFKS